MRLSLAFEMQRPVLDDHAVIEDTLQQCILADEVGFDAVWFVEHHFLTSFSMSPCPEIMFGALSRLTKRIRLGFGVVILPYHHPVRVAERVAMVDHMSGGRVEFGTGRSAPYEQTGMGIDPRDTRAMWEESLRMIPRIWEDGLFSWEGKFWSVPPRDVRPKPLQKPHPRIWVAALQPATDQLAESWGGVPEHLKANFARYLKGEGVAAAPEVDLSGGSGQIASALWNQIDADTLVERGVLVAGDPDDCLRSIAIHEAAGVDELQFLMATETVPHDKVMSSIEMFGKYVIPELKRRSA